MDQEEEPPSARGGIKHGLNQGSPLTPLETPPSPYPQPDRTEDIQKFEKGFRSREWKGNNSDTNTSTNVEKRALVIAIAYGHRTPPDPLGGTYADAYRIIQLLINRFGYTRNEISVLADIVMIENGIKDETRYPNKSNIKKHFQWLTENTGPDNYRFLFFAGHGCRRIENSTPSSLPLVFEGIVPADIEFQPYQTCQNCICELQRLESKRNLIAHPQLIIWDYELNDWLAGSLGNGAHLTVVFDCCHSGGTLSKSLPDSVDVLSAPGFSKSRGRSFMATILSFALGALSISTSESPDKDISRNLIGLPKIIDLEADQSFDTLKSRSSPSINSRTPNASNRANANQSSTGAGKTAHTEKEACHAHRNTMQESFKNFGSDSRIFCWAGCWDYQLAYENDPDKPFGGRFTTEFIKCLGESPECTYRQLNRAINDAFRTPFYVDKESPYVFQRPQLYTSANMGNGSEVVNKFEQKIEM